MSEEVTKKILKEMEQMSKGGEGSGQRGHRTQETHTGIVPRDLRSSETKNRDKFRRQMKVY